MRFPASFLLIASSAFSLALDEYGDPPPRGEPFFKFFGEVAGKNCNCAQTFGWTMVKNDVGGWAQLPLPSTMHTWVYPERNYAFSGSYPPGHHHTVRVYLWNRSWLGPAIPYVPQGDPPYYVMYHTDSAYVHRTSEVCQLPGGAGE